LFGYVNGGAIENLGVVDSYIKGFAWVGGLAGTNGDWRQQAGCKISNCYAIANVFADQEAGGLVGRNSYGTISDSYAAGKVEGVSIVGGLVGGNDKNGIIRNSYSKGKVIGTGNMVNGFTRYDNGVGAIGGFAGGNSGIIINSYYNSETSGQCDTGKGEGKTTEQMRDKGTYIGWDFENVWDIDASVNDGLPYLRYLQY
jgi:hypothetical protein